MTGTVVTSESIGKWLKRERHKRGWTMDELARDAGLSKSTVVRLETTDNTPSMFTIEQIVKVFGKRIAIIDK